MAEIPAEVYEASALDYDAAVNAALGNIPGSVLGESGRGALTKNGAFRAAVESAYAAGRASIHTEWAASLAQADDIEALRARVRQQLDDAEARGYARAVAALRDLDRYRVWLDTANRENGEPWIRRHSDYLEAVGGEITPPPTEAEVRATVAQEIRTHLILSSCGGNCFQDRCDCRARDVVEQAAKIAEGGAQTPGGSE